jgi:hypothetical protein
MQRFLALRQPSHQVFVGDYRDFFELHCRGPIGLYYYDADHSYQSQLEGLLLAEPHLAPGAYILIDDINWPERRKATSDFLARSNGRYRVVLDQRTAANEHPTFWNGLIVLRRN